jgi:hypothetical protein
MIIAFARQGQEIGHFPEDEVPALVSSGQILPSDDYWHEGLPDWRAVAAALAGGSKRTAEFANKHGKPWLHLSERGSYQSSGERLAAFVRESGIKTLNVAGSRGSKEPGVAAFAKATLEEASYPRAEAMVLRG